MKNLHGPFLHKIEYLQYLGEERYRALVEYSIHAYFLINPDGNILETNHVAMEMFGYSKKEFLLLKKHELFHLNDNHVKILPKNNGRKGYESFIATGIKKNGEQFPIELSSVIFYESNGEVRTSTMVYDMSNLNYSEPATFENNKVELDFKPVIESITDGFFTLDNNWIITYWNKEVEILSGINKEDIVGKSFLEFFKEIGNLKLYSECRRSKRDNVSIRFEEFNEKSKKWIEIDAYPSETGLTVFCKNITEQKTAEAAMKLSNERYDLVVKATNDMVWDWDILTGDIYRNSNGVKRVYGHSNNDQIKTNELWAENIHPDDKEKVEQQIAYYLNSENESFFNFEYRYKREDGKYNYINDKGYIIRNDLGIVIRMIGAARDITEQKQIARNIEESELRYKMFVQQSTEGIWRIELDEAKHISTSIEELIGYFMTNAYVAECNDAFARIYGYENAGKIIGKPLHKIMPPENPANYILLENFFTSNFKIEGELSYEYDTEGNEFVYINNMIGIIEGDHIKSAWGTQRNITQQKKADQLLLASEEQYRYLFNNNPSCIFIWDPETMQIMEANQASVDLYGYTRDEFLQLTALDIRPVEEHEKFLEMIKAARQKGVYKKTITWLHQTKKGESIYMEISSHKIIYHGKEVILAIGNNVTDKIQLEKSLNEERKFQQQQITDAVISGQENERSELAQELHDNINQLLASTRLYIDCAINDEHSREDLLNKGRVLLDNAMQEIRKLSKTLLPPSLGKVSLLEALDDLINERRILNPISIIKNWKGFEETGVDQKLKLTIYRIVQEQLNNIYKHAQANNIIISLEKDDQHISLVVKDDGIGFNTASKKAGVGLRNIASRAEVNKGTVHIESAPGEGCELTVQFLVSK